MNAVHAHSAKSLDAKVERAILASDETHFQFERKGYFVKDDRDFATSDPVFNRTVSLRDSYKPDVK